MSDPEKQIFDSCVPRVKAGTDVDIRVEQTLRHPLGGNLWEEMLHLDGPNVVQLSIKGPQTQLAPADIAGVYPTPGSEDSPDEFLPHIALTRRTLPWERAGPTRDTPWLALLVFKNLRIMEDVPAGGTLGPAPPITSTRPPGTSTGPIGIPIGNQTPTLRRLTVGQIPQLVTRQLLIDACKLNAATPITALFMPNRLLTALLPNRRELHALCHVKRETPPGGEPRDTAIVVSHCLPDAGPPGSEPAPHTAVLVSLEQRQELYDRAGHFAPAIADHPNSTTPLLVLHYWQFTPSGGGDFEEVMKAIGVRPNGGVLRFGNLPQPVADGDKAPLSGGFQALLDSDGYLREPLPHTQPGANVAYRGPLLPFRPPLRSSGFAVRAAPEEFADAPPDAPRDYSHAAAFELGRMLTLADPALLEDLRNIRGKRPTFDVGRVAVAKLPAALLKPGWRINPASGIANPGSWAQQLDWVQQLVAPESILRNLRGLNLEADFTGIVAQPWNIDNAVIKALVTIEVAAINLGKQVEIPNIGVGQLEIEFGEVRAAALG